MKLETQIFGARYYFTESSLVEVAEAMLEMGLETLKFDLNANNYPELRGFEGDVIELLNTVPYRKVLDMPFKTYMMWYNAKDWFGNGAEWESEEYARTYKLAEYLLTTYNGTGKHFMIGNWEGDWLAQRCRYYHYAECDIADLDSMTKCIELRQKAISDARSAVKHENIMISYYVEVNLVTGAKDLGLKRLVNYTLPKVQVDSVSYSCYDALNTNRLTECLLYIEQNANFTNYLDEMFYKKVFIGEFDAFMDYGLLKKQISTEEMIKNVENAVIAGFSYGVQFMLFWEFYNNEECGKFKIVDEDGNKMPMYYYFLDLNGRISTIEKLFEKRFNRQITRKEFTKLAYMLRLESDAIENIFDEQSYVKYLDNVR